jgi:hypothetical protein
MQQPDMQNLSRDEKIQRINNNIDQYVDREATFYTEYRNQQNLNPFTEDEMATYKVERKKTLKDEAIARLYEHERKQLIQRGGKRRSTKRRRSNKNSRRRNTRSK